MGYALIWIESLVFALFFSETVLEWGALLRNGLLRFVMKVLAVVPLLLGAAAVVLSFVLSGQKVSPDGLGATIPWMLVCSAGVALAFLRRRGVGGEEACPRRPALVSLAALAALFVTMEAMDATVCRQYAEAGAEARAINRALEPLPVPDEQNAAIACAAAFEMLNGILDGVKDREALSLLNSGDLPAPGPGEDPVPEILRKTRPVLGVLHRASGMAGYRLPGDYGAGGFFTVPSLLDTRRAANLLALEALSAADRGDAKAALAGVEDIRRHARFVAGQPGLICCMIGISVENTAAFTLEDVLSRVKPVGEGGPDVFTYRWPMQRAILSEKALGLWGLSTAALESGVFSEGELFTSLPRSVLRVFFMPVDLSVLRRWNTEWLQTVDKPFHKVAGSLDQIAKMESDPQGLFVRQMTVHLKPAMKSVAAADARIRLSALGLAAAAFRARENRYPASLDELVSSSAAALNTVDPFDGRPLRLKAVENGLILYSVGADRADNGGVQKVRTSIEKDGEDILFCLGSAYKDRRPVATPPKAPGK
jgi:hypothetical protein